MGEGYVRGGSVAAEGNDYVYSHSLFPTHDHQTFGANTTKYSPLTQSERYVGPKGLLNVGNTCYANAVLQCLLSTALTHALVDPSASAIFRRYSSNPSILEQGSGSVDSEEERAAEGASNGVRRKHRESRKPLDDYSMQLHCEWLSRELNRLTIEYHSPEPPFCATTNWLRNNTVKPAVVDPGSITRHPNWLSPCLQPYQQEDAHEFLRALLGTLAMHGHNKELSSLFDGLLESSVVCQTCRRPSLTRDRYMDLSLDIERPHIQTLDDALKEFTKTEILTGDNKAHCSRCETKRTVSKGLRLATAPSILVTHLKRFAFDQCGRMVRLSKRIEFPLKLEIGDYMSRLNKARPPPYELVAVLVHQGVSCDYGHYLAYVKQCGQWYKCNDSSVEVVEVETVLNQQAYLLMYEVAEMREKHGFPSPSKAAACGTPLSSSHIPFGKRNDSGFSFTSMICGMDYDSHIFDNVCYYASSFARRASKPQHDSGDRHEEDDDIVVRGDATGTSSIDGGSSRRKFRRSSSSGNLNRLHGLPNDSRFQSRSVSLHRRHRNPATGIKPSLSPDDSGQRNHNRRPKKGDLPPRHSCGSMSRRYDSEVQLAYSNLSR